MLCNCCKTGFNAERKIWRRRRWHEECFLDFSYEKYRFQSSLSVEHRLSGKPYYFCLQWATTSCITAVELSLWENEVERNQIQMVFSGWANRVSTCRQKQKRVWINKCHCATYLLGRLHHFYWAKKKTHQPQPASLTEDTVSPSGSLLQWQSFVSELDFTDIYIAYVMFSLTGDSVLKSSLFYTCMYVLLSMWMCLCFAAMKADRKRLKVEKADLVSQMQQLYTTLESREEQLREFIRNYDQHRKVTLAHLIYQLVAHMF